MNELKKKGDPEVAFDGVQDTALCTVTPGHAAQLRSEILDLVLEVIFYRRVVFHERVPKKQAQLSELLGDVVSARLVPRSWDFGAVLPLTFPALHRARTRLHR